MQGRRGEGARASGAPMWLLSGLENRIAHRGQRKPLRAAAAELIKVLIFLALVPRPQ